MRSRQGGPTLDQPNCEARIRKRVCKACDRCRLKKSKCNGLSPCARCRADNTICVFAENKKVPKKGYPKGYVEALEQQQVRLVHGLQELYRRSIGSGGWIGEHPKLETDGQPLIHNLLLSLGALDHPNDNTSQKALDGLQQEDECTHAEFQHLKSTERGSDSLQLPVASSRFARDTSSREGLPLTPPTYSLSTCTSMDNEPEVLDVSQFAHSTTVHGVINPEDHYCSQERPYLEFSPFDDIYSWSTPEAANIYFGDQPFTAPTSNWQHLKDGASQERYHDSKSYYEDFDNFSC